MRANIFKTGVLRTKALPYRPCPTLFFFPGLTSTPIWDVAEAEEKIFGWLRDIRQPEVVATMRAEHEAQVKSSIPSDYSIKDDSREGGEHKMHKGDWTWRTYISKGERSTSFASACPTTASFLDDVVGSDLMTNTPFSFAFFSTLHGHSSIAPHAAPCNLRLRVHLPLATPSGASVGECGMRVGAEMRSWHKGPIIFDDSFEHETWNRTTIDRTVLLFDVWHPDLSLDERSAIIDMFAGMKMPSE
jgi:hypothetical protein